MSVVLSEHLPLLASAPDGIQKLRGLILELAVRGKLVPQDPKDEPASELLKRIAKERARLEAEGVYRRSKPAVPVGDDERLFALPDGWEWIRLGLIGDWGAGATPLRSNPRYYDGAIPWFKSGELTEDLISKSEEHVTALALKECSLRRNKIGDVLIAMYGATIGKTAILATEATTNQAVCACTPNTGVFNRYLLLLLKALKPNFIGQGAGGAQPNIFREKIIATVAALPPEPEQHRIVAKVNELMSLCDRLEGEQVEAESAHAKLVETLLGTLTKSADAAELAGNWQRLAEHFETLFTTESSLDALKQIVLQLAVMGKLVPQDPNAEPVADLYVHLKLFALGKTLSNEDSLKLEIPFHVPVSWKLTCLNDVTRIISGNAFKSEVFKANGSVRAIKIANVGVGEFYKTDDFLPDGFSQEFGKYLVESGDILIALTRPYISNGLKVCICPESYGEALLNQRVGALKTERSKDISPFIYLYLSSIFALEYVTEKSRTLNQPNLNIPDLRNLPLPLPPLSEQHRIVAKVDELMVLCDRLKADLAESRTRQTRLSAALIETALQAA